MSRILVVEDEISLSMLLYDWIEEMGHEVVGPVASVADALRMISSQGDISAAILDLSLDNEDSYPIADVLATREIPYAFATGYGQEGLDGKYRKTPTLDKPFDAGDLESMLSRLLTDRAQEAKSPSF